MLETDPVTKSDKYKTVPLNDNSLLSAEITGKPIQSNNECPKSIIRITDIRVGRAYCTPGWGLE